jgi:DNA polymerase-1
MSEVNQRKKFAIIDGKSVFYRGYFAMPNLATKTGTPTGGVYGFAVMALEVIRRLKPDYVAVAWDKPKTNIRKRLEMYPEYKAGRKPPPPDFYAQIPILHELLEAFGWPLYELDDYEADDIMGTLATEAKKKDIETLLITSDMDVLQLVNSHTKAYLLKTGLSNIDLYSPASFTAKYGLDPDQFIDLKALKGDSSDNIPGVPGIGEKTAIVLLKDYKTLDEVYDNLALIKESTRVKLEKGKDLAYLSKKLGSIWVDAPIKLNLKEVDGTKADPNKIRDMLQKLEFKTLLRQLPEIMQIETENVSNSYSKQLKLPSAVIIDSESRLKDADFGKPRHIVVHSRCAGKHGRDPTQLFICTGPKQVFCLDLKKLSPQAVKTTLAPLLEDPNIGKIGYDIKSTIKAGYGLGLEIGPVGHDVLIGAFDLNSLRREQSLTELANADLGYEGSSLDDLSDEELLQRAPEIIAVIRALYEKQVEEAAKIPKFPQLFKDIEWPIIPVLAKMEYEGIELDVDYLKKFSEEIDDLVSDLEQQIYGHADQEFNIGSPSQLAEILFEKLNLPKSGIKKGKTGYSTAAKELDKLRDSHPIIDLISQYREVTKLKNTYVDALPKQVDENNRLHTTFNLTIAQTGRLSSTDPNLQNIPVRTDLGKRIRTAFIAGSGKTLISADYSQFELRLAAYLSDDKQLIEQFNKDLDVHSATAAQIYNREPEDVTKNMRRDAKVVNFGVMYGLGAHGLTQATGMNYDQAKHFIERYFEVRPKLLEYINSVKEKAAKQGYVETLFGRRRPTPDIHSSIFAVREAANRAAVNMPFQGTAADIMKLAMVAIDKKLAGTESKVLLQIHDSVLVEGPEKEAKKTAEIVKDAMENVYKLPIKLTVDTSIGKNWGLL